MPHLGEAGGAGEDVRSIHSKYIIYYNTVVLHFFVERGAVDVERPGGLLAVPVEGPERLDDDPLLGLLQGFPQGVDPHAEVGQRRAGGGARPAVMVDDGGQLARGDLGAGAQGDGPPDGRLELADV